MINKRVFKRIEQLKCKIFNELDDDELDDSTEINEAWDKYIDKEIKRNKRGRPSKYSK